MQANKLSLTQSILLMHLTVIIWAFTGILGNLITISPTAYVWYRVMIAIVSLFLYFKLITKDSIRIPWKKVGQFAATGFVIATHWLLFFHSIRQGTVSVTLVCVSSVTLFTAILEPLFNKRKIDVADVIVGLMIVAGIILIFSFESQYAVGIILGLTSALFGSVFGIFNSIYARKEKYVPSIISFYELIGAVFFIFLILLVTGNLFHLEKPTNADILYIVILGTFCTAFAFVASVMVMKQLSAFRVALITNLEPIYGIFLALVIFGAGEKMSSGGYLGAVIVLASVFIYPTLKNKMEKRAISLKKSVDL